MYATSTGSGRAAPGSPGRDRYLRQTSLPGFGGAAQEALVTARVLVIGAGGLGSTVLPALAAAGVGSAGAGRIGIIDDDVVESSNLHRQYIHGVADVARPKIASAADALAALNPETRVIPYDHRLTAANALELFAHYDLVVDGSDNFPTRYLANDAAQISGIPLVWGAVSQYAGQTGVAWAARGPQYRDLFPTPPPPGSILSCADGGVLPTVCAVIGSIMATETIKILTGVGMPLIGRVTTFDALSGGFREIRYDRDPAAEPVTGLIDYDLFCGVTPVTGSVTAVELAAELAAELEAGFVAGAGSGSGSAAGRSLALLDVREPWEVEVAEIPGSILVPLGAIDAAITSAFGGDPRLSTHSPIVVYCHHGIRSGIALDKLRSAGFTNVRHLEGGIDAWSREIDPSRARY